MNGPVSEVASSVAGGARLKTLKQVSGVIRRSAAYMVEPKNFPTIRFYGGFIITILGCSEYGCSEANTQTSISTRLIEAACNGTYSPDPDTRSKAALLRRKGVNLLDCCEPGSRRLDPDLIEDKYEVVKPYEPIRYRLIEQKATSLEQEKLALEQKATSLEQKATSLEQEKLALEQKATSLEQEN